MNDIAKRIAELSPEKRKLLLERLNRPAALPIENGKAAPENITRPRRDSHTLPLSFAQQRLWFLDQLEPGSAAYNIPLAFRIDGALDSAALQHAFDEIIQRHEILRTTFDTANEQPVQIIAPVTAAPFTTLDLGELSATARTSELQRLTAEEAQRPFDLRNGPLLRITLLRFHEKEHVLLLTLHHIIADGWSSSRSTNWRVFSPPAHGTRTLSRNPVVFCRTKVDWYSPSKTNVVADSSTSVPCFCR